MPCTKLLSAAFEDLVNITDSRGGGIGMRSHERSRPVKSCLRRSTLVLQQDFNTNFHFLNTSIKTLLTPHISSHLFLPSFDHNTTTTGILNITFGIWKSINETVQKEWLLQLVMHNLGMILWFMLFTHLPLKIDKLQLVAGVINT